MVYNTIKENSYYDSVTLMLFSSRLAVIEGIEEAAIMMGSAHNIDLMLSSNVLSQELANKATSNDLLIGIRASSEAVIQEALKVLDEQFNAKQTSSNTQTKQFKSVKAAKNYNSHLNLSIISTPGRFAKAEVVESLKNDLNVLLFSDNVSIEDEVDLKNQAIEKGLLMMGPDCGTAIINGVALGFANKIKAGSIGLIAASGTGLQEVSSLIDLFGGGITQAIGVGGRDMKEQVGGRMTLFALDALINDPATEVIGIISKPPSLPVMQKIQERIQSTNKKVVTCFLGASASTTKPDHLYETFTLENAARYLVAVSQGLHPEPAKPLSLEGLPKRNPDNKGTFIRGLYTGGTLAYEAMLIFQKSLNNVYANIAMKESFKLPNPDQSIEHTIVDLGEDYFTDGLAHPMIDPRLRNERLIREANDSSTAVILLDCVIGYGSHENPALEIVQSIKQSKQNSHGKTIDYVASVTGTASDVQSRAKQIAILEDAGVTVLPTNAQAAQYALLLILQGGQ